MDIEELRQRLLDYYGTAVNSGIENAMSELNEIEDMSDEEITSHLPRYENNNSVKNTYGQMNIEDIKKVLSKFR